MDWIERAENENTARGQTLSFFDYMDEYEKAPQRESRTTHQYLIDMLDYFGKDDRGHYKLFQIDSPDAPPVYGQLKTQQSIIDNLHNFKESGFNNKFILLVGPNGSSKSSIVKKLMKGAEEYSKQNAGALYTFSWVFPIDTYVKGNLGLTNVQHSRELKTFAYLEDKDISAILNSELKDHPLLLIPKHHRQNLIDENLRDDPEYHNMVKSTYLYQGDLSKRNRMIYDALLQNYKGKHSEVLKHIRVERFIISKRYSNGAVTIEPQMHVDARMQQITMDKRLATLPPSLQSLNLFSMQGEAVSANRGILEYSDLLKRPLDTFKYLLQTMETKNVNLMGILTELDIFFVGTSNEIHLQAFKQHPDFNSFKGRFNFIRVPYLLDYKEEEKIYEEQVSRLKERTNFEPYSLKALCMFAVMTRLRSPMGKHYKDKKLTDIVTSLNPLEKCHILSGGELPDRFDIESKQILKHGSDELKNEFEFENLYEGKFGISPRDIKNIIYRLSSLNDTVTFVEVFKYLERVIQKKNDYDFLNMTPHGDFHNPAKFIDLIKDEMLDLFDRELRSSLGLIDDRSYEDYLRRYIENINAMIKGEKIKNTITGKYEECDEYFIKEFESNINLKEDALKFRSHLISKLGAFYLDNPGIKIIYKEIFPEVVDRLQESFRNEQKKAIVEISKNLVFYEAEMSGKEEKKQTLLTEDSRKQILTVLENLTTKYGYSQNGALQLIKFIIKERY